MIQILYDIDKAKKYLTLLINHVIISKKKGNNMLNQEQLNVLGELFESDQEFRKFATNRMKAIAKQAEERAQTLNSFLGNRKAKPNNINWQMEILDVLQNKRLKCREIMEELSKKGLKIKGGTLTTYLHAMKRNGFIDCSGKRGKFVYFVREQH